MTIEVINTEEQVSWVNASGISSDKVEPFVDRVGRELANWVSTVRTDGRPVAPPSIFNRAAYVPPDSPYAQMQVARNAVENDDVVGGVADVTEALMFQGVKWEASNADDADVFNQIARDLDLDSFVRQWAREDFMYSQAVVGIWWGRKTYNVRGKTKAGNKKRKTYSIWCPTALTYLDPQRVVPLSPGPFGQDRLAWHATKSEYAEAAAGVVTDSVMREFTTGPITVSKAEGDSLVAMGIDPKRLIGLNERAVFRITRTKASYDRFPPLRLKSVFPLLDLKQQLIEADRVSLVGAANFILLVRQGTKDDPALPEEIQNLKENFKVVAKLPVVIGDHRLQIDIITPDQQYTLEASKYDTLDRRIMSRVMGAFTLGSSGQRNESTLTAARGIARLLENRRHMLKRELEKQLARATVDHPANDGAFEDEPNLTFTPRNVQIDTDAAVLQALMSLRTQKELSRESILEYFGFDQAVEALRREFEEESGLDDIFQTQVPFSAAGPNGDPRNQGPNGGPASPQSSGAAGGRPVGGGQSRNSPQRQTKPRTGGGNPSTSKE